MSKYTQENIVSLINKMYPDVDTSEVVFTKVRDNIILKHHEFGRIERTPESILKSKSLNFNGQRIKAETLPDFENLSKSPRKLSDFALKEIEDFIKELGVNYIKNYKVEDYRVSFYFPDHSFAVNFNSTEEIHSSNSSFVSEKHLKTCKPYMYNFKAWKAFSDKGITVMNIFDFYWVLEGKKEIIFSKIKHGVGLDRKVFARKCSVRINNLSITESKAFLNENHLEGAGFYYKDSKIYTLVEEASQEVLMVAVVGLFYEQGSEGKFTPKLSRIATKRGITVVGGISKLTKAITEDQGPFHYLITLSSGGSSIRASEEPRYISPRYFWVDPKTLKYYHRNYCQKLVLEKHFGKPLFEVDGRSCTEREYMESLGYLKVFDQGLAEIYLL